MIISQSNDPHIIHPSSMSSSHICKELEAAIGQYVEEPWDMIGSYFENGHLERLVRHQLESFNDLVYNQLERTIGMFNPVHIASEQDYDRVVKKHRLEIIVEFKHFNYLDIALIDHYLS